MAFKYGKQSLARLAECELPLQILMQRVLERSEQDITILCGARGQVEQDAAYKAGNSKLKYPKSKHNKSPSQAVDAAPYPIDWKNLEAFKKLGALVLATWETLTIEERGGWKLSWGGDWKKFKDLPHYEISKV